MKWIENWLNDQSVVISDINCSWRPVNSGVPLGSVLAPALFSTFVNDLDGRTKCTCDKSADDTKMGGETYAPEDHGAIQRDLNWLEK